MLAPAGPFWQRFADDRQRGIADRVATPAAEYPQIDRDKQGDNQQEGQQPGPE